MLRTRTCGAELTLCEWRFAYASKLARYAITLTPFSTISHWPHQRTSEDVLFSCGQRDLLCGLQSKPHGTQGVPNSHSVYRDASFSEQAHSLRYYGHAVPYKSSLQRHRKTFFFYYVNFCLAEIGFVYYNGQAR